MPAQSVADRVALFPFAVKLGMTELPDRAEATFVLPARPVLVGNPLIPALHGGAVAAFLETACAIVLARHLGLAQPPEQISINLQFLISGKLADVVTMPVIKRIGRRIAVLHAEAWQDDGASLICSAQCDFRR